MPSTSAKTPGLQTRAASCPHCKATFEASIDKSQPLRLQGAKCPSCKLFVPMRVIAEQVPTGADQA